MVGYLWKLRFFNLGGNAFHGDNDGGDDNDMNDDDDDDGGSGGACKKPHKDASVESLINRDKHYHQAKP